jgi:hypothetical protein
MSNDATSKERAGTRADIWRLPTILDFTAVMVRYSSPLIRYEGQKRIRRKEAVEILVKTDGPIPERALSPILMVGDEPVSDYEFVEENLYRFYGFEAQNLREDAPVSLEWPQRERAEAVKRPVFRLKGEESR